MPSRVRLSRIPDRRPIRHRGTPGLAAVLVAGLLSVAAFAIAGPAAASDPEPSPSASATSTPAPSPTPSATPSPSPTPSPPPPTTITFYGRGYGHGLGMSQYGALGRAVAGQPASTILAHYYAKTSLATLATSTAIRVLLATGYTPSASVPARVIAHKGAFTVDGIAGTWPAEGSVTLVRITSPSAGWQIRIARSDGTVLRKVATTGSVRVRPAASTTRLQVWFVPGSYDTYRGTIRLLGTTGGRVSAINETTLEGYLRGVVPAEMPWTWPVEALRAQSIAARSYAAAHLHPTTGSWDVYGDSRSQVYRGWLGEKSTTTAAVASTAGMVLKSGTHVATALFHSADGGATENNENVYVSPTGAQTATPVSYLRGSSDRASTGMSYDHASPHATWKTASYTLAQLSTVFGHDSRSNVGTLSRLDLSDRGVSGRLISVTLVGSSGTKTISGEIFRSIFNTWTPATDPYMWSTLVATAPIP
jgi:stage II sporulation protein D